MAGTDAPDKIETGGIDNERPLDINIRWWRRGSACVGSFLESFGD